MQFCTLWVYLCLNFWEWRQMVLANDLLPTNLSSYTFILNHICWT